MNTRGIPDAAPPLLRLTWEAMPQALQRTVTSAPVIPLIAARAKAAAVNHPGFIRGDQGQVVGVMPDREVYYGPSSGLPELRRLVGRFWTLAYGLRGCPGLPESGLEDAHVAIVSGATEGLAILMRLLARDRAVGVQKFCWGNYRNIIAHAGGEAVTLDFFADDGSLDLAGLATAIAMGRFSAIPGSAFGAQGCIRFGYAGIEVEDIERMAGVLPEVLDAVRCGRRVGSAP